MLNKQQFVQIMTGLCELYKQNPSEFLFDVYYRLLKDYDTSEIEKAIDMLLKTYKYNTLPKPAEILQFLEGTPQDKALEAWLEVVKAIKNYGYYETIEFYNKTIHHCIEQLGGWMWLCSQPSKDMIYIEKRFLELYKIFNKRELKTYPKMLGFIETKNTEKGYPIEKPIKIGFKEEQKVLENKNV